MTDIHIWTHQETLLLIECYRKYEAQYAEGKLTKDRLWKKVAEDLLLVNPNIFQEGLKVVGKKCCLQITTLTKQYKQILKINKKTGNGRAHWEYFEILHEIFHKKPWVQPLSVAGSSVPFKGLMSREQKKKRTHQKPISEFETKKIELLKTRIEIEQRETEELKAQNKETVSLLKDAIASLEK